MDEELNGGSTPAMEASVSSNTAMTEEEELSGNSLNTTPGSLNLAKKPTTSLNGGATQDMRSWNKVLLQWINECNFIECNYFYIEQSDIESFYKEFRKRLNNGTTKDTENHRKRLKQFIEDQYPDFLLHLDDENELSSADYIYVYSLLLHYCCIKCADEYFHNICKQLSNSTQSAIASFFNILVESEVLDRDCLRHAIAAVVEASPTTPKDKDESSMTPKRGQQQLQRISPSTPKTFLLEERTRELFNLRAALETERYDKGVLEVQIRQYEETILNMKQDHRKLSAEMQELKSQLLAKQMDGFGDSEKTDSDDIQQYKRRLHKQISDKEEQMSQLSLTVSTLEEDKTMLQQKLKFAQNQVIICMDRVNELDCRVEELNQMLEQRDQTITSLVNSKAELEQHIAEARAAARHIDLNTSVECMDSSFARTTNSSSLGSPENLGVSVIDVQLRETEKENQQLRERLENMRHENNALIANMHNTLTKHWEHYKVEDHQLVYADEELSSEKEELNDEFEMFKEFVDKLSRAYGAERESTRKLQTDNELLQQTNETLNMKLKVLEEELEQLKERAEAVAAANHRLDSEKGELANQLLSMEKEMQSLKEQSSQINAQLTEVNDAYEKYTERTKQEIKEMQEKLMESHLQLKQSSEQHDQLKEQQEQVQQQLLALEQKHTQAVKIYEDRIRFLEDEQSTLQEKLQQSANDESQLIKKNEQLLLKLDEMQASALQTDEYLSSMNKSLENEQKRAKEMGDEIQLIVEKNKKLEDRIMELQGKQEKDDQRYKAKLQELTEQEAELRLLYDQTYQELKIKEADFNSAKEKLQKQIACVESLSTQLNEPISSSNSTESFTAITNKVSQLLERSKVHETVIQQLELACDEKSRKITVLEAQCSEAYTIKLQLQAELEKIDDLTKKCRKYESEIAEMRDQQAKDIAELKDGMAEKANHYQELIRLKELQYEESCKCYEQLIKELEGSVKSTVEERDKTVHTLESALKKLEVITGEQIEQLQKQLESTRSENSNNLEQLQKLRTEHSELEQQLEKAQEIVKDLQAQLKEESFAKQQITEQLELTTKELDDNNYELEQKLSEMQQRNDLIEKYDCDIQQLQKQLEVEKVLNTALNQSTNQLQAQVEQSHKREAELFKKIEELQAAKQALDDQHTALEADLVTKEAEMRVSQEESFQVRAKLKSITAKLTEAMAELESKDFAIEDILAVLENNYNLKSATTTVDELDALSLSSGDMPNFFNVSSGEDDHDHFTQLKCALNRLMQNYRRVELQLQAEHEKHLELELMSSKSLTTLRNDHHLELQRKSVEVKDLQEQCDCQASIIKDLQDQLSHELEVKESKLRIELKQLFNERANLENVNKKLSTENSQMQERLGDLEAEVEQLHTNINELKVDKDRLNEELKASAERYKKQEQKARDSQKEQSKMTDIMRKQLEGEFEKLKSQLAEADKHKAATHTKLKQLEHKLQTMQQKQKELQAELEKQQKSNELLEAKLEQKCKAYVSLESAKAEVGRKLQQVQDQLMSQSKELESVVSEKLSLETKYAELQSEQQQNMRELEVLRVQRQTTLADIERLTANLDACNGEKLKLHNNLNDVSRELQRANDNLSQLIQEIASIRREKEGFINENQLLAKQLNEINKIHETSESQLKEKLQSAQSLERQMLAHENELKSLRDLLDKHMRSEEKLNADNAKLRESSESQTKRIERYALQLGEAQAKYAKLERENDKISTSLQAANAGVEELKREKEVLQGELRILKEKHTRLERTNEQLSVKLKSLESANTALRDANIKLEHNDMESINKIKRLEKQRQQHEEKLRNLNNSLAASDATGTRLNLEIGALNSQLQELRKTIKGEYVEELQSLERRLKASEKQVEDYEELSEKLKVERQQNHEQIAELTDKQEKLTLALEIQREKCSDATQQLEQLRGELLVKREEHSQALQDLQATTERFESYKAMQEQLYTEKCNELQAVKEEKEAVELNLAAALEKDRDLSSELAKVVRERGGSDDEVQELRSRIKTIVDEMAKEQEITAQLRLDNQILQAKYREAKQQLIDESKASEQRLKENRLELEGKLEKMKSKMKNLYTEEVAKMKTKHDRELVSYKEDKALLTAQNTKYEEHNRKLSNQIVRLNERVLELKTENTILSTKVKHLEEKENCSINAVQQKANFKRPSSIHVTSTTISSGAGNHHQGGGGGANIGTNLAMEDEEGEVFNNTYLTDLKNGRMSELMSRDVCAEELKYRNSLLPPHLKSTYAAQYFEQNLGEDDIKDGPHSLDDSMSALLSTTSGGTRKKCTGVTHYKRPGPPTPSKNGGRLSFGSSEPPREILKETFDTNVSSSSSSKTPARFGFFTSRFSMGATHVKEEQLNLPQTVATTKDLRRFLQMRQLQSASSGGGSGSGGGGGRGICTSTPRKSRAHDLCRNLEKLRTSTPKPIRKASSPAVVAPKCRRLGRKSRVYLLQDENVQVTPLTALPAMLINAAPIALLSPARAQKRAAGQRKRCNTCHRHSGGTPAAANNKTTSKLMQRYLRRLRHHVAYSPATDDTTTTNSPASSLGSAVPATCHCESLEVAATTPPSTGDLLLNLERQLRRRRKTRATGRVSLNVCGNMFARQKQRRVSIGGGASVALKDLNVAMRFYTKRKERNDNFFRNRAIPTDLSMTTTTTTDMNSGTVGEDGGTIDETFDLTNNNNYSTINHNKNMQLNETMIIEKSEDLTLPVVMTSVGEQTQQTDIDDGEVSVEASETFEKFEMMPSSCPQIKDELVSEELGSSQHFEHLLAVTESQAPFEVNLNTFETTRELSAIPVPTRTTANENHSGSSSTSTTATSTTNEFNHMILPCSTVIPSSTHQSQPQQPAQLHQSSTVSAAHLSRTIYGGCVVINRRLPHIDSTCVRKSSIYIKNQDRTVGVGEDDIILVTNQTITLADLMRMWSQMNVTTRCIVAFVVLASIMSLITTYMNFVHKSSK